MEANTPCPPALTYAVDNADFAKLRARGNVYVDKTELIYRMTQESTFVFLSRPRRFGKSLLCSTLKNYFEGRRDLFAGLAIERLEQEWTVHPVIHLSMSQAKNVEVDELRNRLIEMLRPYEQLYGACTNVTPGARLDELIKNAYRQTGREVVIIIDEYDAPLLDVLHDETLDRVRKMMQEFYTQLKDNASYLRFCFITGITKFSQLSIFSTINNLRNISMLPQYAALCGITEGEVHQYLAPGVDDLAQSLGITPTEAYARLKEHYDGYHFTERAEDTYNPFSLLSTLLNRRFDYYWFASGTPTFLIHALQHFDTDLSRVDGVEADSMQFDIPTEAMTSALPLLYQSGYLTIKSFDPEFNTYILGIPNREVRVGLSRCLLPTLGGFTDDNMVGITTRFARALTAGHLDEALTALRAYFAGIAYPDGGRDVLDHLERAEWYYAQIFYLLFSFMNLKIRTEVRSARGRADMVMFTERTIYVFEFKVNHPAEEALRQIDDRGYMIPYEADGRRLVKCGVSFSSQTRTLAEWKVVELA